MNQLKVVSTVLDTCPESYLASVFAPIADLPLSCTKAEMISHCLNTALGAYGLKTYLSFDKTQVLINDEGMCKVMDFFKGSGFQPILIDEHLERIKTVVDFIDKGKVDMLWAQSGKGKAYYYLKQYSFNGFNLYSVLNVNTLNSAAVSLSPVGSAGITMAGIVALSWTGSLFFSTLENYISNTMPVVKSVVSGAKFVTAFPIPCVEFTSNSITGFVEDGLIGRRLPTNVTQVYRLDVGPKLKNLGAIKKPVLTWLINSLFQLFYFLF